ncbi:MAG: NAD(P)-dependent oxidoreductase [Fermentimonas sp.]|jgi:D-3-phosphoglycerate dehydrogenase
MKVLLATTKPFAQPAVKEINDILEAAGHTLIRLEQYTDKQLLIDAVKDVDAIIVRSDIIDKEVLDAAKNLKVVVRAGSGYDNIDLEASTANDVCVMNTPGQNSNAVAELVFGMIIYMYRNRFSGSIGRELMNKRISLYAFGNVAKNVARIARGFKMKVYAFSPTLTHDDLRSEGKYGVITAYSKEELFSNCDIMSLHVPLLPETRGVVDYDLLSQMPMNGLLVNTARKEIIVEDDLIRIMEERKDFKFITDICPDKHEIFKEKFPDRYFATAKKMGAQTSEANQNAGIAAAHEIVEFFASGDDKYRVNKA